MELYYISKSLHRLCLPVPVHCTCITQPPATGAVTMDHRCGDTRGCFVNCEGNDCQYVVSWHYRPEYVDFSITRKVTGGGSKWLAIGFSSDPKMVRDS